MRLKFLIISLLFTCNFSLIHYASAENRHPRVVELEKSLAAETLELLKGRFPNKPFLATVNIDALMRDKKPTGGREKLPYYEIGEEEIADEWDDPDTTSAYLLNRVRRINVKVSIPSSLSDDEVAELKQAVFKNLSLLEARDNVEIQKRSWSNLDQTTALWVYIVCGLGFWLLTMFGAGLISWFSSRKLSESIATGLKDSNKNPAPSQPAPIESIDRAQSMPSPANGDIRFNDPIKTRESIHAAIKVIESHGQFPVLEDMIIFDKFSNENTPTFGALLSEFSWDMRKSLFSFSTNDTWLQALSDPGEVNNTCLEVLQKCARVQRGGGRPDWQQLLVLVWRLNQKASDFFKNMDQDKAFNILGHLPRSLSVAIARNTFPGAWGILLNPKHSPKMLNELETKALIEKALSLYPVRDFALLDTYCREKDLLNFVRTADPQVEKEIYQVSKDALYKIRAPFFPVFEAEDQVLIKLVSIVRVEDWALSFYNIPKTERKRIEALMGDRQRVRCYELLRQFDQSSPLSNRIGDARERIAKALQKAQIESIEGKGAPESEELIKVA